MTSSAPRLAAAAGALLLLLGLSLGVATLLARTDSVTGLVVTMGLLLVTTCFIWPEFGLYVLLLSFLLGPEILVGGAGGAAAGRGLTLRLDDFLLLIIVFTWLARGAVFKDLTLFRQTPLNTALAGYLIIAALATGLGMLADRVRPLVGALFVLKYFQYAVVYFAVMNYVRDKEHLGRLIKTALITALLVSLYALAQIPQGIRVSAPFEGQGGEPNTLGGYLLFMIALLSGLLVSAPSLRRALPYIGAIFLLGVPFLYTLSRASYLGLLFALPIIVILSRRKVLSSFAVVTVLISLLFLAPEGVMERIRYTFGGQAYRSSQVVVGGVRLDTSTSARIESIEGVLRDFPRHPLLGYGVTGYAFVDGQYQRVLIETGLLGLAAFFWLLFALGRMGWHSLQHTRNWWEEGLGIGYLAGLCGLLVHALGSNTFIIVRIMQPFWFFTGAIVLLHHFNTGDAGDTGPEGLAPEVPS